MVGRPCRTIGDVVMTGKRQRSAARACHNQPYAAPRAAIADA